MNFRRFFPPGWRRKAKEFFLIKLVIVFGLTPIIFIIKDQLLYKTEKISDGILWLAIALTVSIFVLLFFNFVSSPRRRHFIEIQFGNPDQNTMEEAIEGIINADKAQPEFIHVAPISFEALNDSCDIISETPNARTFIYITGGPGEGKSMYAYHLSYQLHKIKQYKVYQLTLSAGIERYLQEIKKEFDYLKGKRKIILIDEAHHLVENDKKSLIDYLTADSNFINSGEKFKNLNKIVCWINTEFFDDKKSKEENKSNRIDVQRLIPQLIFNFYLSPGSLIHDKLVTKIDGLKEAATLFQSIKDISSIEQNLSQLNPSNFKTSLESFFKGQIEDPWTFNFIASDGQQKLIDQLESITHEQRFLLFFLSAKVVISSNREQSFSSLQRSLFKISGPYYVYNPDKLINDIRLLETNDLARDLKSFISTSPRKNVKPESIIAHHYNTAKCLVKALVSKFPEDAGDYMMSVSYFLSDNKNELNYLAGFVNLLGTQAPQFLTKNRDNLCNYFNEPLQSAVFAYHLLINVIRRISKELYEDICSKLDGKIWTQFIIKVNTNHLRGIGDFLCSLGHHKGNILNAFTQSDWKEIANKTGSAPKDQYAKLSVFIDNLGENKSKLFGLLTQENKAFIAREIGSATMESFKTISPFVHSLGSFKTEIFTQLTSQERKNLAFQIGSARIEDFMTISFFLNSLDEFRKEILPNLTSDHKENLVSQIRNVTIEDYPKVAGLISSLKGQKLYLINVLNEQDKSTFARQIGSMNLEHFQNVSIFLNAFDIYKSQIINLLSKYERKYIASQIGNATLDNYRKIGQLLDSFEGYKRKIIDELTEEDYKNIARQIGLARIGDFNTIATLVNSFEDNKSLIIQQISKSDFQNFAKEIVEAKSNNFQYTVLLLTSMDPDTSLIIDELELLDNSNLINIFNNLHPEQLETFYCFCEVTKRFGTDIIRKMNFDEIIAKIDRRMRLSNSTLLGLTKICSMITDFHKLNYL
ncbi:MAG: AAA family ATPase [Bacteroidetes bacterium]|nr:AAA family ATPase [Bacteroidota bacterium]